MSWGPVIHHTKILHFSLFPKHMSVNIHIHLINLASNFIYLKLACHLLTEMCVCVCEYTHSRSYIMPLRHLLLILMCTWSSSGKIFIYFL